ncbi:acetyl esterase/lipase [Kitasatospora sp. MAA4]|uniref:alpha/beta hydrolase family protein n=1 Tax=Kitasatospora sp. MAA4 TaxID=3035093 RepID=UPI00247367D3|nr:alpha/beta hydrolase [Kitasatospora sp. MAA4]MDH6131729.1 acetyl esterase/lipase [Kitasatospora sp. MAA4]
MSETTSATAAEEEDRVLGLAPVDPPFHHAYGEHPDQVYDLWPAEDPDAPLVMLLHGGYWRDPYDRRHLSPLAAHLAENGFTAVLLEYRRTGGAGGFPTTFDDIALAVDTIPAGRPVVLVGHCSGGHLALWAGARGLLPADSPWYTADRLAGVLALAPVTDLAGAIREDLSHGAALELLGSADEVEARLPLADPITLLRGRGTTGVPTVVLHGMEDPEVPLDQFTDYAAAHPTAELVSLPGTGHYTLIEPGSEASKAVIEMLTRLTHA